MQLSNILEYYAYIHGIHALIWRVKGNLSLSICCTSWGPHRVVTDPLFPAVCFLCCNLLPFLRIYILEKINIKNRSQLHETANFFLLQPCTHQRSSIEALVVSPVSRMTASAASTVTCYSIDISTQEVNGAWAVTSMERHMTAETTNWLQRSSAIRKDWK